MIDCITIKLDEQGRWVVNGGGASYAVCRTVAEVIAAVRPQLTELGYFPAGHNDFYREPQPYGRLPHALQKQSMKQLRAEKKALELEMQEAETEDQRLSREKAEAHMAELRSRN